MRSKKDSLPVKPVFFNRELSWVEFNARVLHEALDREVPPLERFKFLSIVSSNFDEFFMIRVATLKRQLRQSNAVRCPSGLSPSKQLQRISIRAHEIVEEQYRCLDNEILPALAENGIKYASYEGFTPDQRRFVKTLFDEEIFLSLTPIRIDPEQGFPFAGNLRMHFLFQLKPVTRDDGTSALYALVQIPPSIKRMHWLSESGGIQYFTLLKDIIIDNTEKLFQGYEVQDYCIFRVTRDADLSVDEERDEDFLEAMEEVLISRESSRPVRLEVTQNSGPLREMLVGAIGVQEEDVYEIPGIFDLASCMGLAFVPGYDHLRDETWKPAVPIDINEDESLWETLRDRDMLFHHPYESFDPVIKLIRNAAKDPKVIAIKMTLYRTSTNSPIVRALANAAENGKQVSVLVELKARFDEQRNIEWAEQLQRAGAIVIYGIAHLKVHAKALLIVRRELEGVRRYVHLGTGNYNEKTAKLYTDIGYLTSRDLITYETALFFNAVTGYSSVPNLTKLFMAPVSLKYKLLQLIDREIDRSYPESPGFIMAKMNSLADSDIITALYRASCAGVKIQLNIRGICMLVPGVEGLSDNITVISLVDRFLEHSRIFYFSNQGQEEVFLSSADWMPRNLERRVELMFPVEQENLKKRLIGILEAYFEDNRKVSKLHSDGSYRYHAAKAVTIFRAQQYFFEQAKKADETSHASPKKEFSVRRTPHSPNR